MTYSLGKAIIWLSITLVVLGCASPSSSRTDVPAQSPGSAPAPATPKRLVVAIQGSLGEVYDPPNFVDRPRGVQEVTMMVHASLTVFDTTGQLQPQLAENVPTIENGLWTLDPDGTMATTWRIRPGAEWHDGVPFTTDDLVFALQVARDPDLPILRDASFSSIESVDAVDPQTIRIHWKGPFIRADQLFSDRIAIPMPKHILESIYAQADKSTFLHQPYWSTDFVGLGPYRLKDFQPSVRVLLQANDRFVTGRPKIDEIEVQTIADSNAIVAALLAGTVDVVLGRAISVDQAVTLRDSWPQGKVLTPLVSLQSMNPQFLDPTPAVVANLQFRRAVLMAIDRQQMADSIEYGLLPPSDGIMNPNTPLGRATASGIVKYPYDPRQAAQLIEGLGYTKGGDGFYHDGSGQPLRLELQASQGDINPKSMFAAADFLQRLGIAIDPTVIPLQLATNSEYRATFPAFTVAGTPLSDRQVERFTSAQAPVADPLTGDNKSRYMNPEMDALAAKYLATIPLQPRMEIATQIVHHATENLVILPLYYDSFPGVQVGRLVNAEAAAGGGSAAWNVAEWDLQ